MRVEARGGAASLHAWACLRPRRGSVHDDRFAVVLFERSVTVRVDAAAAPRRRLQGESFRRRSRRGSALGRLFAAAIPLERSAADEPRPRRGGAATASSRRVLSSPIEARLGARSAFRGGDSLPVLGCGRAASTPRRRRVPEPMLRARVWTSAPRRASEKIGCVGATRSKVALFKGATFCLAERALAALGTRPSDGVSSASATIICILPVGRIALQPSCYAARGSMALVCAGENCVISSSYGGLALSRRESMPTIFFWTPSNKSHAPFACHPGLVPALRLVLDFSI